MSKEAMKLALEALNTPRPSDSYPPLWRAYENTINTAIKALEEALAKQEQGEPVVMKPSRISFEHFWIKTRSKKARNEIQRHPKQPDTYISDSANRHWVTWQAATTPQQRTWVGLTDEERNLISRSHAYVDMIIRAAETKLKEKNT